MATPNFVVPKNTNFPKLDPGVHILKFDKTGTIEKRKGSEGIMKEKENTFVINYQDGSTDELTIPVSLDDINKSLYNIRLDSPNFLQFGPLLVRADLIKSVEQIEITKDE